MGNQVYFEEAIISSLARAVGYDTSVPDWTIHLYKNAVTPVYGTTVIADFDESTFDGYTALALSTWNGPTDDYPFAYMDHSPQLWAVTGSGGGSQDAVGYWVEDGSGNLIFAEEFDTPIQMNSPPDYVYLRFIVRWESLFHAAYPTDPLVPVRLQVAGRMRFVASTVGQSFPGGFDVHLFKNDPDITDTMVLGDFVECDFGSYTTKTANVWTAPIYNPVSGFYETGAGNKFWFVGSGGPTQDAYGFYVTENPSGELIFARKFLTPFPANDGDLVACLPLLSNWTKFLT